MRIRFIRSPTRKRCIVAACASSLAHEGVHIWDSEGNRFLDGMAGLVVRERGLWRGKELDAGRAAADGRAALLQQFLSDGERAADRAARASSPSSRRTGCVISSIHRRLRSQRHRRATGASLLGDGGQADQARFHQAAHWRYHGSTLAAVSLGGMPNMQRAWIVAVARVRAHHSSARVLAGRRRHQGKVRTAGGARALEEKDSRAAAPTTLLHSSASPAQGAGGAVRSRRRAIGPRSSGSAKSTTYCWWPMKSSAVSAAPGRVVRLAHLRHRAGSDEHGEGPARPAICRSRAVAMTERIFDVHRRRRSHRARLYIFGTSDGVRRGGRANLDIMKRERISRSRARSGLALFLPEASRSWRSVIH